MYGYIYKTTNLINNKIYIGQKKSTEFLAEKYLGSGVKLKSAIKHYDNENFKVELVDTAESKEELDNKEIYWIEQLNSRNADVGYNISKGGDGNNTGTSWNKGLTKDTDPRLIVSDSTRLKHSESLKKAHAEGRHKVNLSDASRAVMSEKAKNRPHPPTTNNTKWYTNGVINKMLHEDEVEEYVNKGFYKGKTMSGKPAWNKGLTKETDERIAKYSKTRNERYFNQGKSIGCYGKYGKDNSRFKSDDWIIENILNKGFKTILKTHGKSYTSAYFHIGKRVYNRCLELLDMFD